MADKNTNRYSRLIEEIFFKYYQPGDTEVPFERKDIETAAAKLEIVIPKNLGDVIYSFVTEPNCLKVLPPKPVKATSGLSFLPVKQSIASNSRRKR
jgi:hypothetical protein